MPTDVTSLPDYPEHGHESHEPLPQKVPWLEADIPLKTMVLVTLVAFVFGAGILMCWGILWLPV